MEISRKKPCSEFIEQGVFYRLKVNIKSIFNCFHLGLISPLYMANTTI